MAPPGTRLMVSETPTQRKTFGTHGVEGWYIGPALQSYRCYKVWVIATRKTLITDMLKWFPHQIPMPMTDATEVVIEASKEIAKAIKEKIQHTVPPLHDSKLCALQKLMEILKSGTE